MTALVLNVESDNVIAVTLLKDNDGNIVTGAIVTATITDSVGTDMAGVISLAADGAGNYEGVIDSSVAIVADRWYYTKVTAINGALQMVWREYLKARYARF